jgi:hypothetical protein
MLLLTLLLLRLLPLLLRLPKPSNFGSKLKCEFETCPFYCGTGLFYRVICGLSPPKKLYSDYEYHQTFILPLFYRPFGVCKFRTCQTKG